MPLRTEKIVVLTIENLLEARTVKLSDGLVMRRPRVAPRFGIHLQITQQGWESALCRAVSFTRLVGEPKILDGR